MRILIAEDDPVSRRLLEAFLSRWGYDVVSARDGAEAWELLQRENAPTLAILDWMMPGMDGVQVCRKTRERVSQPYVYILMLTAKDRKQDLVQGIEAGADEYMIKPFDAHELKAHLLAGKRILDLQEQLIRAREELRVQATHDLLTGLWNHASILDIVQVELERAQRQDTPLGLVMGDLDHFKSVNDTYGHPAGDAVLREVARRMHSSVRPYDSVGRYGGEEFLVVVPGCDPVDARHQAERLRASVRGRPIALSETSLPVTISLGVAATSQPKATDAESLLRAADAALYLAKHNGRDRVESSTEAAARKVTLEASAEPPAARR
ncbi:MAG TPA: diguanylate cyclase [Terriglobia bacterium]|nr:diguanylate cyclase [Terriglobia bacterium]